MEHDGSHRKTSYWKADFAFRYDDENVIRIIFAEKKNLEKKSNIS